MQQIWLYTTKSHYQTSFVPMKSLFQPLKHFFKWFRIAQEEGSTSAASVPWLGVPFPLSTAF